MFEHGYANDLVDSYMERNNKDIQNIMILHLLLLSNYT